MYATRADLAATGLRAGVLTGISTSIQDAHLAARSAEADTHLRGRYRLPLAAPYDPALVAAVAATAAFSLLCMFGFDAENRSDVGVQKRSEAAEALLADVRAGRRDFDAVEADEADEPDATTEELAGVTSRPRRRYR